MPRETRSGASGRPALATLRDEDFENIVAAYRYLPTLAEERGVEYAVAWAQTNLRSLVDLLALADPRKGTPESAKALGAVYMEFRRGHLLLACEKSRAGWRYTTAVLQAIENELFRPAVRAVFERSAPRDEQPYAPQIPQR